MKHLATLALCILAACTAAAEPQRAVDALLSRMHEASKNADATYFDLFADDAVFFGTDLWERWTKDEFEALYKPYMESGKGWEFKMRDRRIDIQPCGTIALFDETLFSESFGPCRGSGTARLDDGEWTIVRYHLDITIPNGVVDDVVPIIRSHEANSLEIVTLSMDGVDPYFVADVIRSEVPEVVCLQHCSATTLTELTQLVRGYEIATDEADVRSPAVLYKTDTLEHRHAESFGDAANVVGVLFRDKGRTFRRDAFWVFNAEIDHDSHVKPPMQSLRARHAIDSMRQGRPAILAISTQSAEDKSVFEPLLRSNQIPAGGKQRVIEVYGDLLVPYFDHPDMLPTIEIDAEISTILFDDSTTVERAEIITTDHVSASWAIFNLWPQRE